MHPKFTTTLAPPLQQVNRTYVLAGRRKLSYFAGCDYFRLSSHPRVMAALQRGLKRHGLNVAASRRTTGNHKLYALLEQELARFFAAETAVLVSAGYLTNLAVAEAFAGEFSHVLIDERSHPSLFHAAKAFEGSIIAFRHRDVADVVRAARSVGSQARLILLTDGLFSHDGSVAPLVAYQRVLPASAWLLVDDAHGAGVLGRNGRGTLEYVGADRRRVIQTITLSKAFGVYGGAILGSAAVRNKVLNSHSFVGNTPLPLPLVSATREAVRLLAGDASFRGRLTRHTQRVKSALATTGFQLPDTPSPIIPLLPRSPREREKLTARLLAARIYPPFIQYPGGPQNGYFRFVLSSEHTEAQVDALLRVLVDHLRPPPVNRPGFSG